MASKPGILTDWPWKPLGKFKYLIVAPWAISSTYMYLTKDDPMERDFSTFTIFPILLSRYVHNQIWISLSHRWDNYNNSASCFCCGILILLASQSFTPPLPLFSLSLSSPFLHCHRAHYFCGSSICRAHGIFPSVCNPIIDNSIYRNCLRYITYIDFMNNLGHCNFEFIPKWFFSLFPLLKYLMYTPSFHSLHHTQFRTNYCLFMPMYDYIYGTVDESSENLYEMSLKRKEELPNVVYLTHMTTPESIYHMEIGFPALASRPHSSSKWYLWLMWPLTALSTLMAGLYARPFLVESHRFHKLTLQTWAIPKYKIQYFLQWQKSSIYVKRYPELKVKVVDGSSLAVGVILNSIPKGTTQVLLTGNLTKVAYAVALALSHKGIQVASSKEEEYKKLKKSSINMSNNSTTNECLVFSQSYSEKIWLVGDGLSKEEQVKARKGTIFIPFSQFPPKPFRKDCFYHYTPAMHTPSTLQNLHSCENWLPRRVMSAWRIAGIVHGLEGWNEHECGFHTITDIHKVWEATLRHGFHPLPITSSHQKF
ncbi:hypothetical protein G4B88_021848 [Cannabis sativa]|uniref:Uncharacterized protein n=1 Tax=Cannabis sativa TaxID=3483 RepID=A0A7J6GYW2_CANSA|nr:hypothetical protein G4B88_021848 [Cannabis sativa]